MNTHKIPCREEKRDSLNDYCSFNLPNHTSQNFGSGQQWSSWVSFQPPTPEGLVHQNISQRISSQSPVQFSCLEGGSPRPDLMPSNPSCSPLTCFQSQSTPFYVGDCYPGFPPCVYQVGPLPLFSQFSQRCSAEFPSRGPSEATSHVDFTKQSNLDSQAHDTLQSVVKYPSYGNQNSRAPSKCSGTESRNLQESELFQFMQSQMNNENDILDGRYSSSAGRVPNSNIACGPFNSTAPQSNFQPAPEKQLPNPSGSATSSNVSPVAAVQNKTRIRWTQDLHERFVESVNRLGGPEKATPKEILKRMDHEGLTIFHVKSHLQKYRIAKHIPDSAEARFERRTIVHDIPQLDLKTGIQITEALRLQLDVQRRLHEQLEVQQKLQMQIEKQGKQLQKMFEQQQKTRRNLLETQNLDILFPDEEPVGLEDVQVSEIEGLDSSTLFPSKIS